MKVTSQSEGLLVRSEQISSFYVQFSYHDLHPPRNFVGPGRGPLGLGIQPFGEEIDTAFNADDRNL